LKRGKNNNIILDVFHGFKVKILWERNWIVIFSKRKISTRKNQELCRGKR